MMTAPPPAEADTSTPAEHLAAHPAVVGVTGRDVDRDALARDRRAGMSVDRLSHRYHLTPRRVRAELAGAEVTTVTDRSATIRAERERVARLDSREVVAAYQPAGVSVRSLATRFDLSEYTIRRHLHASGIPLRSFAELHAHLDTIGLVADYQDGVSARELARRYGIDRLTVRDRLTAAGVPIRRPGATKRTVTADPGLAADYQAGAGLYGLARARDLSVAMIRRTLVASGVTIRSPGTHRYHRPV